jgi:hypothetical protein
MDLLGRKLGMKKGQLFIGLLGKMQETVAEAKQQPKLQELADLVAGAVQRLGDTALKLGTTALGPGVQKAFSFASPFMEVTGDMVLAWMHLWRASIAARQLEKGAKKKDISFYEGQLMSAEYFIRTVLPVTQARMKVITGTCAAAVEIADEAFGGR